MPCSIRDLWNQFVVAAIGSAAIMFAPAGFLMGQDVQPTTLAEPTLLFADSFQDQLADGWEWLRPQPARWCVRNRGLEIRVWPGFADSVENALLRTVEAREDDRWIFEVTVTNLSAPTKQWEQAGLTWYGDGRPVFKLVKELVDGRIVIMPGNHEIQDVPVELRLAVQGQQVQAFYRTDFNGPFLLAGEGDLPPAALEQISLQCYHGPNDSEHWIRFGNFRVLRSKP
ncbi:MAG: hypothetical protein JNK57_08090 [Planctomycetaceae bacterium]|nr:hypothetical protein [Planctomycetaceae bacterium]